MSRSLAMLCALLAAACAAPPTPPAPSTRIPPPSATSTVVATLAPAPTPTPATPWYIAARVREPFGVVRVFHDARVVGGGPHDLRVDGDEMVEVEFTKLANPRVPAPAFKMVQGDWPRSAWLADELVGPGDSRGTVLYRFTAGGWRREAGFDSTALPAFLGFGFWTNGTVLTVVEGALRSGGALQPGAQFIRPPRLRALAGSAATVLPALDVRVDDRLIGFTALPHGDLFLVGSHADGRVFVDHWAAGATRADRSVLPAGLASGPPANRTRIVLARSPVEAYLAGGSDLVSGGDPYLARFDGTSWTRLDAPTLAPLQSFDVTPDGEIWAVFDGPVVSGGSPGSARREVWKRSPGARAWTSVQLVAVGSGVSRANPIDVLALGRSHVWILADVEFAGGGHTVALLHDHPVSRVMEL